MVGFKIFVIIFYKKSIKHTRNDHVGVSDVNDVVHTQPDGEINVDRRDDIYRTHRRIEIAQC